jgi:hypothetical protein
MIGTIYVSRYLLGIIYTFVLLVLKIRRSCVSDAAMTGILHNLRVLEERALVDFERRSLPGCAALLKLFWRDIELERVLHGVDRDDISVLHERDRAPNLSLRHNVANAESVAPAHILTTDGGRHGT